MLVIRDDVCIDLDEVRFRFSPSSGPGGQHVNRASTRVTLIFDVAHSASLTEAQRERVLARLSSRLDGDGVLRIQVQDTRSQSENRERALERLRALLAGALREPRPRRRTAPPASATEARLAAKRQRSQTKATRRAPGIKELGQ